MIWIYGAISTGIDEIRDFRVVPIPLFRQSLYYIKGLNTINNPIPSIRKSLY
jgi:hypothetical protein